VLNFRVTVPPAIEPVSLTLAKQQIRVDFPDDDALITSYITASRQYAENYTRRAFFNQTIVLSLDHFPYFTGESTLPTRARQDWAMYSAYYDRITIRLPRPSCVSVQSITYVDLNGVTQTLPASAYYVDTTSEPGRIVPTSGSYWPYTQAYVPGSVQVSYLAGSYGDGVTVNNCPQTVIMAIMLLVGSFYENRSALSEQNLKEIPMAVSALLDQEVVHSFSFGNN
jgi:hypothetical protein